MEKYGTIMMNGIFLLIMLIGLGILLSKMGKISDAINVAVVTAGDVMETSNRIINSVGNVCNGGSGLIPS